jgi:orotidine-5'-phosphate decarboxylase
LNPIIVALDVSSSEAALRLVEAIGPAADFYKVGMELYAVAGMNFVRRLSESGKRVFLDLKLYDIGETVRRATQAICEAGHVEFLTVHGSVAVMQSAVQGRGGSATKLLAVTVLTSFDQTDLADLGYQVSTSELVQLRVKKAAEAGMDGVVCSPLEVKEVRRIAGPVLTLVTPGVRSEGAARGDQKRVATPAEAIKAGADYLVIGRQVTRAPDPRKAVEEVASELRDLVQTP